MLSINFILFFVPLLSFILIAVNFLLAPHTPYKEKKTPFECGYHSFTSQTRTQFNIMFSLFGFIFLLLDLEIVLTYPYGLSSYNINIYGLITAGIFVLIVTLGFGYEIGKGALNIESRQSNYDPHLHSIKSDMGLLCLSFFSFLFTLFNYVLYKSFKYLFPIILPYIRNSIVTFIISKTYNLIVKCYFKPFFNKYVFPAFPKIEFVPVCGNKSGIYDIMNTLYLNFHLFKHNNIGIVIDKKLEKEPYLDMDFFRLDVNYVLETLNYNNSIFFNYMINLLRKSEIRFMFLFFLGIATNLGFLIPVFYIYMLFSIMILISFITNVCYTNGYFNRDNSIFFKFLNFIFLIILGLLLYITWLLTVKSAYDIYNTIWNYILKMEGPSGDPEPTGESGPSGDPGPSGGGGPSGQQGPSVPEPTQELDEDQELDHQPSVSDKAVEMEDQDEDKESDIEIKDWDVTELYGLVRRDEKRSAELYEGKDDCRDRMTKIASTLEQRQEAAERSHDFAKEPYDPASINVGWTVAKCDDINQLQSRIDFLAYTENVKQEGKDIHEIIDGNIAIVSDQSKACAEILNGVSDARGTDQDNKYTTEQEQNLLHNGFQEDIFLEKLEDLNEQLEQKKRDIQDRDDKE